jgi:hypothetical protein
MEHRWGQRSNVQVAVRLRMVGGAAMNGCLQNLSVSGAFVHICTSAPIGALLELEVPLTHRSGHHLPRACAYVARRTTEGIGIEWCDLAPPLALELLGGYRTEAQGILRTGEAVHVPDAGPSSPNRALQIRREPTPRISAA